MIRNASVPAVVFLVLATVSLQASGAQAQILLPPDAPTTSTNAVQSIHLPRVVVSFGMGRVPDPLDRARVEPATRPAPLSRLQQNPQKAGWMKRHPILLGTLIGFGTGFVIGCLPHEDNALYLFGGCYNGLYVGGIGAGIGAAVAGIGTAIGAQKFESGATPARPSQTRALAAGVAVGTPYSDGGRPTLVTLQLPVTRFFVVEPEVSWRTHRESDFGTVLGGIGTVRLYREDVTRTRHHRTVWFGSNLLFRAGPPKLLAFAGGGIGVHETTEGEVHDLTCTPVIPGACDGLPSRYSIDSNESGLSGHLLGGIDVSIARRLTVFGQLRAGTAPREGIRVLGGARVALHTREVRRADVPPIRPASAEEKDVRVTRLNRDSVTGRLISLSSSEVVIRRDTGIVSIPLGEVHKVERVSHHARIGAAVGAAWAAIGWMVIAATRDTCMGKMCE